MGRLAAPSGKDQSVKQRIRAVLCAVVAGLVWQPAVAGAQTWTEVRSPNFRVVTNAGARSGREVAANFERLKGVLQTVSRISTRSRSVC